MHTECCRSLRYHGTAAIGLPRTVPEGGIMCCERFFPEGVCLLSRLRVSDQRFMFTAQTEMSVPFWTIQHDPVWSQPRYSWSNFSHALDELDDLG